MKTNNRIYPLVDNRKHLFFHTPHHVTHGKHLRFLPVVFAVTVLISTAAVAENRIQIDTQTGTLTVLDEEKPILVLDQISIGRFGARRGKTVGDGMTPLGEYRITSIRKSRRFHFFIGLNYPSAADADRGLKNGILTPSQAEAIRTAHAKGNLPPQNTPLGGHIGLHGVGIGDLAVHARYNWTRGCVAVTNAQLDQLLPLVRVGTRVEIR
ncbi:L,D-transpeptidase family protein [Thiolapillus sp.]